jgi:hypothetical protein
MSYGRAPAERPLKTGRLWKILKSLIISIIVVNYFMPEVCFPRPISHIPHPSLFRWVLLAVLCWILPSASGQAGDRVKGVLRVGYLNDFFIHDAKEGESRTQFEPWVRDLVRHGNDFGRVDADRPAVYDDFIAKLTKANDPPWDVFPMYAYDFVELKQRCNLDALLVPEWGGGPLAEYVVYVAQNSRITKLIDLQQKNVLFEISGRGELPFSWFDNQFRKQSQNKSSQALCNIHQVSSAMQAALPVYFGEDGMEACLLSTVGFQQVVIGNPGLGTFLRPIATAPALLTHVIACRKDLPNEYRQNIVNLSLAFSARTGKTTNALHFSPFKPEYLESVEHEWLEYLTNSLNDPRPAPNQQSPSPKPKNLIEARAAAAGSADSSRSATSAGRDSIYSYPTPPPSKLSR